MDQTKLISKLIKTTINTAIIGSLIYAGCNGYTWAIVVFSIVTWLMLFFCIAAAFSNTVQEKIFESWQGDYPFTFFWFGVVYDFIIIAILIYNQWFFTGFAFVMADALAMHIKFKFDETTK